MERSEFCKKLLASGVACGCALGLQAGNTLASPLSIKEEPPANPNETPCNEKVEFTQKWIKRFMDIMDQQLDEDQRRALMLANGAACAQGAYGEITALQPATLEEIDQKITEWQQRLGKENIYRTENTVYFNYVRNPNGLKISDGYCLCPMIENGPESLSPTYCQCSAGYVQFMFHKLITGKPVKVELLESLRGGGKACRFKVMM